MYRTVQAGLGRLRQCYMGNRKKLEPYDRNVSDEYVSIYVIDITLVYIYIYIYKLHNMRHWQNCCTSSVNKSFSSDKSPLTEQHFYLVIDPNCLLLVIALHLIRLIIIPYL